MQDTKPQGRSDRRSFLTTGAMLTAGALLLPRSAGAVEPPRLDGQTDLLARVRAILTTRRSTEAQCRCPACVTAMAQPIRCADCGYAGPPATESCGCARAAQFQLEHYTDLLRKYPTAARWPSDWKTPRREVRRDRRQLAHLLTGRPVGVCLGHGKGQPSDLDALCGFDGNCVHCWPRCPVCDGFGDDGEHVELGGVLAILREVNGVLFPAVS